MESRELSEPRIRTLAQEDAMRCHFSQPTPITLLLLALPALALAYCIATILLPAMIHAIVPDAVRSVLSLM